MASSSRQVRAPQPHNRNILITSALPYVNNVPHLGNIIGCVLSADVYARYCRNRSYNVLFISGTDEYGTATETRAIEKNLTPGEICESYHAIHKDIYNWFDIDFDHFGRTSTPLHTEITQSIFTSLNSKDLVTESTLIQPYCTRCSRFLADRLVEGTCVCGYTDARGDQCDHCGKLLNANELITPHCKVCGDTPESRVTDHLFLDLPALTAQLQSYVDSSEGWSTNSIQQTKAWMRDGLKPRCITRDLKWGVPVPLEDYSEKVFYVWFDAPIGYISITAEFTSEWEKWWKARTENVELVQFMGKDNVPFHTVMFPGMLLGTEQPWTLMKTISATEHLNYESTKFSKSRGVGVFGDDVQTTNIPVEVWRYYLLRKRPEVSDTEFTWADLQVKLNNELLKNLGNFVHRTLSFLANRYNRVIPEVTDPDDHELTITFAAKIEVFIDDYLENMEAVKLKAGLEAAMEVSSMGNAYLQESQFWKLFDEDANACAIVVKTAVGVVHLLATLLEPFMPSFSRKVLQQMNLPVETCVWLADGDAERASRPWSLVPSGHTIGDPEPIFIELTDEEVERFRLQFAGSQATDHATVTEAALSL